MKGVMSKKIKVMESNKINNKFIFILFGILIVSLTSIILIYSAPSFTTERTISYANEDQLFTYNFSKNVTNGTVNEIWTFTIENVSWNRSAQNSPSFYSSNKWITIDPSTGILSINATNYSQTGRFNLTMKVVDQSNDGSQRSFYFIVNDTNDAPNITGIQNEYNLTQDNLFSSYLNATDEENHFPLLFNINFTSCIHAGWSTRAANNCSLFNAIFFTNSSGLMSYTSSHNDVGIYYANISVNDSAANYVCASGYCAPDFSRNKSYYYPNLVTFNVLSNLEINASNCENRVFNYSSANTCNITIITKGINDSLSLSSYAILRNYNGNVANTSWFLPVQSSNSTNFTKTITINVTPQRTEIGNWTINFTVNDLTYNDRLTAQINITVNRSSNDVPEMLNISNKNTSITLLTIINISVYDDDFLIPDKNYSYGGFNETSTFSAVILNASNLNQGLTINGFSNLTVQMLNMPVFGTNRTRASITITPNLTSAGNYTINLTVNDFDGVKDSKIFNFSIIDNQPPKWDSTLITNFVLFEGNTTYLNLSQNITDPNGDTLTFSFSNDTIFPSFSLGSSTGVVNFIAYNGDVGYHVVTITATDAFGLSNSSTFAFTIHNVNETPYIASFGSSSSGKSFIDYNATLISPTQIDGVEDNLTKFTLIIEDNDFKIPNFQKTLYYREIINLDYSIQGPNSSLLNFIKNTNFPTNNSNVSRYDVTFTPRKNDVGNYNITMNATDNSNRIYYFSFNLTINAINHPPVISDLVNKTTAVGRNLYYRIDSSDVENGYTNITDGNGNFTYTYNFINGTDFINNNESIFNSTTGLLNITFNSSQAGRYRINITVNDTGNLTDSKDFWIFVYDTPTVNFPLVSQNYYLSENSSQNFTFRLNHTMNNELSYLVYAYNWNDSATLIQNSTSYYGNNTNLTFSFTPNFMNETNGVKNLTLIAYPMDANLFNRELINITSSWNLTVNHTNYALVFSSNIGGSEQKISGGSPQNLILSNYFYDYDSIDYLYNQTVAFNYSSLTPGCAINVAFSNWTNGILPSLNFTSISDASCNFSIDAGEYNQSNPSQIINAVSSNNFTVEMTVTTTVVNVNTPSGGSSTITTPISIKILTPGPISAFSNQKITVPIKIENTGKKTFYGLDLKSLGFKDGELNSLVDVSLDKTSIASLAPKSIEDIMMTINIKSNVSGNYEILINATSTNPKYSDWGKLYINLQKSNDSDAKKYLVFTEEYLANNPQCLELQEYLNEANAYFEKGDYGNARVKAEQAISACKEFVSQEKDIPKISLSGGNFNFYLMIAIAGSFVLGFTYYIIKRQRIKKGKIVKVYGY